MLWLSLFLFTFVAMEGAAWFLHRFVMHGFLWNLHLDHHEPAPNQKWQKNDFFAFFFAVPSFLMILVGTQWGPLWISAIGFGIMAYGLCYFFVHEVVIHRRFRLFRFHDHWYAHAVIRAHRDHHKIKGKYGCENFGMLIVPLRYFIESYKTKTSP